MGVGRGTDRRSGIRWLRSNDYLGRSSPAEGLGTDHGADHRHRSARDYLDLVSANSWQWKRHFGIGLQGPGRAPFAAHITRSKARSDDLVHAQWGARRDVHAIADIRSHARRRVRAAVVTLLARCSTRNIRFAWSWGCGGSYNSGSDICSSSNDGIDGKRSFFHLADATCRGNCDADSAQRRCPIDLRRALDRRRN